MMSDFFAVFPLAATEETALWSTILTSIWMGVRVALGIGLVIFVHELGHFLAAKLFGVKVEKFYVGFDVPIKIGPLALPRTLGRFTYGETEYGIGVVPLGGYVKMLGQDDDPRKAEEEANRIKVSEGSEDAPPKLDPRSYPAKPVWQRMVIISAGVVMNVITGVIFAALAFANGVTYNPAVIGGVMGAGPAWEAGITPGGKVVSVGQLEENDDLHFREMQVEIFTVGLDQPDEPIDVAIRYDDETRKFKLGMAQAPEGERRLIGITSPTSTQLNPPYYAEPLSVASQVLTEADGGAMVIAFNGQKINEDAIVPGTPLFHWMYTHPTEPMELTLRRTDDTEHKVTVPPQPAKWLGVRLAAGEIAALVKDGPAMKAGLKVGDVITAIDGNEAVDAYGLAIDLIGRDGPVKLGVRRGEGDAAETLEVTLEPSEMLQTLPPTQSTTDCLAINAFGLAYRVEPVIAGNAMPTPAASADEKESTGATDASLSAANNSETLQGGDVIQKVTAVWPGGEVPSSLQAEEYAQLVATLSSGWEFDDATPITSLMGMLQVLPEGTKLRVLATRPPEGRVVEQTLSVSTDDRMWFERGIVFAPSEAVQKADSFSEALALGFRRGKWDLMAVFRTLGMLSRGTVELKHLGGPIRITKMAWHEANRGLSPQLLFLTMLSMNLAILNFLPIPALDGGHMMFLIAEGIRGRRLDEQLEMRLTLAGGLALLALMAFVVFNDIYQG